MRTVRPQEQSPADLVRYRSSPAYILRRNLWVFGAFQALIGAALIYSAIKGVNVVTLACMAVCIPPIFVWVTYRECRRAWLGEAPNEIADTSLPALGIIVGVFGLRACLYGLFGS